MCHVLIQDKHNQFCYSLVKNEQNTKISLLKGLLPAVAGEEMCSLP